MMQILINTNDEIINYAIVGGFEDGIEIDNIPSDFIRNFKPRYYLFNEGQIEVNNEYKEETETFPPIEPPNLNLSGTDEELRKMFANMQIQIVQGNVMVSELTQQNARLAQEIVETKQELEKLKGDN
ncbi:phage protein [Staphylococcus nepalensis]|uniref:Phage protein n=2 Tax=Staphylococcus nepalensis TaxID=214473 RepID=A0A380GNQ3_9STAP|nr:hypothetical protein CD130_01785 [Staphylococcus nepalensis]SUM55393.1 phage protein [Staphylococcus nepalensis]VDG67366.1 Protein of uncharacterised function (DUF2977) [Lacrimispora indolis]